MSSAGAVGVTAVSRLAELTVEDNARAPGVTVTLTSAFVAFLLAFPLSFLSGHASTAVHESGHMLFALWGGGTVEHVHVNRNGGGETRYSPIPVVDDVVASAAGYLAPSVGGLLLADLLGHGHAYAALVVTVAFLVFLLIFVKNAFGRIYVALMLVFFVGVLLKAGPEMILFTACTWAWFLMSDGMRKILVIWARATDYDYLPLLGRNGWAVVNLFLSVAAMIWGGLILVGAKEPFL